MNAVAPGPIWTPLNPCGGASPEKLETLRREHADGPARPAQRSRARFPVPRLRGFELYVGPGAASERRDDRQWLGPASDGDRPPGHRGTTRRAAPRSTRRSSPTTGSASSSTRPRPRKWPGASPSMVPATRGWSPRWTGRSRVTPMARRIARARPMPARATSRSMSIRRTRGRASAARSTARCCPLLADKGFHAAFAGIALPNDGSIGLHEAMGFTPVGIYREVGWKMDGVARCRAGGSGCSEACARCKAPHPFAT